MWLCKSTPAGHHRRMGVIVPLEHLQGHGHQGQSGLLSCLHPITRGEYVNGLIHDAAKRYHDIEEQANKAVRENGIALCRTKGGQLTPFRAAAFTLTHEALELKLKDAQFCFGVMYWKGVGVHCSLDRAVELFLMAAEQVLCVSGGVYGRKHSAVDKHEDLQRGEAMRPGFSQSAQHFVNTNAETVARRVVSHCNGCLVESGVHGSAAQAPRGACRSGRAALPAAAPQGEEGL